MAGNAPWTPDAQPNAAAYMSAIGYINNNFDRDDREEVTVQMGMALLRKFGVQQPDNYDFPVARSVIGYYFDRKPKETADAGAALKQFYPRTAQAPAAAAPSLDPIGLLEAWNNSGGRGGSAAKKRVAIVPWGWYVPAIPEAVEGPLHFWKLIERIDANTTAAQQQDLIIMDISRLRNLVNNHADPRGEFILEDIHDLLITCAHWRRRLEFPPAEMYAVIARRYIDYMALKVQPPQRHAYHHEIETDKGNQMFDPWGAFKSATRKGKRPRQGPDE